MASKTYTLPTKNKATYPNDPASVAAAEADAAPFGGANHSFHSGSYGGRKPITNATKAMRVYEQQLAAYNAAMQDRQYREQIKNEQDAVYAKQQESQKGVPAGLGRYRTEEGTPALSGARREGLANLYVAMQNEILHRGTITQGQLAAAKEYGVRTADLFPWVAAQKNYGGKPDEQAKAMDDTRAQQYKAQQEAAATDEQFRKDNTVGSIRDGGMRFLENGKPIMYAGDLSGITDVKLGRDPTPKETEVLDKAYKYAVSQGNPLFLDGQPYVPEGQKYGETDLKGNYIAGSDKSDVDALTAAYDSNNGNASPAASATSAPVVLPKSSASAASTDKPVDAGDDFRALTKDDEASNFDFSRPLVPQSEPPQDIPFAQKVGIGAHGVAQGVQDAVIGALGLPAKYASMVDGQGIVNGAVAATDAVTNPILRFGKDFVRGLSGDGAPYKPEVIGTPAEASGKRGELSAELNATEEKSAMDKINAPEAPLASPDERQQEENRRALEKAGGSTFVSAGDSDAGKMVDFVKGKQQTLGELNAAIADYKDKLNAEQEALKLQRESFAKKDPTFSATQPNLDPSLSPEEIAAAKAEGNDIGQKISDAVNVDDPAALDRAARQQQQEKEDRLALEAASNPDLTQEEKDMSDEDFINHMDDIYGSTEGDGEPDSSSSEGNPLTQEEKDMTDEEFIASMLGEDQDESYGDSPDGYVGDDNLDEEETA